MSFLIDYPWYSVLLCLLAGVAYSAALYFIPFRRKGAAAQAPYGRGATILLSVMRFLSATTLALLFLAPLVKRETARKEKPIILVAEDNSKSLDYCRDSAYYRGEYVQSMSRLLDRLEDDYEVHRFAYGSAVTALSADSVLSHDEPSTDISALLAQLSQRYYHRNIGALLLTGDGIYNSGQNPLSAAAGLAFPVYTVALGDTTLYPDAAVAHLRCNRIAYLGNDFPLAVTVTATRLKGSGAQLTVSVDGRRIKSVPVSFADDHSALVEELSIPADRAGMHLLTVTLSPLPGEHSLRNNSRTLAVEVIDGHQKIALIAAVPHPDVAALRQAIEQNQNYEVETFLASDFKGPVSDYSLLVFHQLPCRLPQAQLDVASLLKEGIPALFVVGSQTDLPRLNDLHAGLEIHSRLDRQNEVTPVYNTHFTLFSLDETLLRRIQQFPPLVAPFGDYKLSTDGQSLLTARVGTVASGMPLVAVAQQQGMRRAFIAGEGLWRWRLADYQASSSHAAFDALIDKLVLFAASQGAREHFHVDARRRYGQNEAVTMEAQLYDANFELVNSPEVSLVLTPHADSGSAAAKPLRYAFNRVGSSYALNLGTLPTGRYDYQASTALAGQSYSASGTFLVEPLQLEDLNLKADHSLLVTLADATGGALLYPAQLDSVPALLARRDDIKPVLYSETRYSPFLQLPLLFILLILLFSAEWIIRKILSGQYPLPMKSFFQSSLFKDGVTLISGNAWAQLIAFAGYLVLTRLFSPEDIGLYNVFYSYIDIFIILSTGKYELATVLADNDSQAVTISRLALRLNALFSLLLLALLFLLRFAFPGNSFALVDSHFTLALLIPPMVYFCGTSRVYASLCNRFRRFRPIALSEVVASSSGLLLKVFFGLPRLAQSALHTLGLPLGTVLGKAAGNLSYLFRLRALPVTLRDRSGSLRDVARRYRNFPLFTMPKDFINSLSYNLPFLTLALYFDNACIGLFGLALTFTFRPVNILNTAFEKLLYVRVADKVRATQPVGADIRRFLKTLNLFALPLFVLVWFFAQPLFTLLFGGRWAGCGWYVRVLIPWVYIMLSSTSLMFLSNVFSRQRTEFHFYLVLLVLRVAAVVAGILTHRFQLAILLFALSGALVSLSLLLWYLHLVRRYDHSLQHGVQ